MVDILKYPWSSIYTTNYDDAIEQALSKAQRSHKIFNNTDEVPKNFSGLPVIHLHGAAERWDIHNFQASCILTGESYLDTDALRPWLDHLQSDADHAQVIVFVGFSTEDLHLNQVLYNISEIKTKTWFINRPKGSPDIDEQMSQSRFGTPHYIGRAGLAKNLSDILQADAPTEPALVSFRKFKPVATAKDVPSPNSIEDLFLFGAVDESQIARDVALDRSDYHILRAPMRRALDAITDGKRVILISGEICDGKTLLLTDLSYRLAIARPVFHLSHAYDDVAEEAAKILAAYPNAVLIVENCFQLHLSRRTHLTNLVKGSDAVLIMTARSISIEAETAEYKELSKLADFESVQVDDLDEREINALINLTDQIAGWRHLNNANTLQAKYNYVSKACKGSLPNFLLSLFKSEYVREKYREEFNKIGVLTKNEKSAVIAALYASRIGHEAPVSFLSNTHRVDASALIEKMSGTGNASEMKLLRVRGGRITTVPSIGAINILSDLFTDSDIVDSIVQVLEHLTEVGHYEDFENTMFQQMMRYSILRSVVDDRTQIDRFFNHISKIHHCREQVLFWLQWHMAETDAEKFLDAEKYLEESYRRATAREQSNQLTYNRNQIDDRKAKFLMLRLMANPRSPVEMFRDFQEALNITQKLIRSPTLTKHPFETLAQIAKATREVGNTLIDGQREVVTKGLAGVNALAVSKIESVQQGHHHIEAKKALESVVRYLK